MLFWVSPDSVSEYGLQSMLSDGKHKAGWRMDYKASPFVISECSVAIMVHPQVLGVNELLVCRKNGHIQCVIPCTPISKDVKLRSHTANHIASLSQNCSGLQTFSHFGAQGTREETKESSSLPLNGSCRILNAFLYFFIF